MPVTRGSFVLYASSWSIASFLGIQHAGKLVQVSDRAFH